MAHDIIVKGSIENDFAENTINGITDAYIDCKVGEYAENETGDPYGSNDFDHFECCQPLQIESLSDRNVL